MILLAIVIGIGVTCWCLSGLAIGFRAMKNGEHSGLKRGESIAILVGVIGVMFFLLHDWGGATNLPDSPPSSASADLAAAVPAAIASYNADPAAIAAVAEHLTQNTAVVNAGPSGDGDGVDVTMAAGTDSAKAVAFARRIKSYLQQNYPGKLAPKVTTVYLYRNINDDPKMKSFDDSAGLDSPHGSLLCDVTANWEDDGTIYPWQIMQDGHEVK